MRKDWQDHLPTVGQLRGLQASQNSSWAASAKQKLL